MGMELCRAARSEAKFFCATEGAKEGTEAFLEKPKADFKRKKAGS